MKCNHSRSGFRNMPRIILFLGVLICGCSARPQANPPGNFTFYDTEVTGYTTVKESNGGYEFGIATRVASIDAIRKAIDAKADPSWSTNGWYANTEQNDLDIISYTKGPSKLTISIQAYKEEGGRKWYMVDYTYVPTELERPQG
ncbi:MAG: hypothetical protein NXI32_11735 [bacterium]|nr:hypothetical protein [bacterium]